MSTTAEQFRRVGEIFQIAVQIDGSARDAFLIEQSGGDVELLTQLRALFRADQLPCGVLDQPALGESIDISAIAGKQPLHHIPERIGRYRILRVLGEGGMGVVYEAEQDEPRRSVAIKVIRPGLTSASVLRRFRHEAQTLGQLRHPCIAQIYEAGTADQGEGGQPYFAMELVSGQALLEFARARNLGTRQRLMLIARICDGVHHAHLNGVIHRDLKPGNILVVEQSSPNETKDPLEHVQPKILDFGIARATEADIQSVTLRTDIGQLLGTVAYMSPEQASGDPAMLDVRSDVYALGVIAYELLSGRLPYAVHGKLIHEAVRVIREDEPSRLSSIDRVFRGDVETIIAKSLEKEKSRRYQSAAELATDIRRYLGEQPIAARPASRIYQMRKFAKRNKAIVGGVAVAFAALAIGTGVSIRQAVIAERARLEERRLRADAERQTYRASLVAAAGALRYHETSDAERHLAAAPQHLRGWEWEHLASRLDDSLMSLNLGFRPMCIAASPDGRLLASSSSGGTVRVWRVPEFSIVATHTVTGSVHARRITHLRFSDDSRELQADAVAAAYRFNVAETLEIIAQDTLKAEVRSRDGRFGIVIADQQIDRLAVVELATGREQFAINCPDAFNSVSKFSSNGELVAICLRGQGGLTVCRTVNGEVLFHRPDLDQLADLDFSEDGSRIALATPTGTIQVISADSGSNLLELKGHQANVSVLAFCPDGGTIASASADRTVRLWDASSGSLIATMQGNQATAIGMSFTADGSMVVTTTSEGTARWWDARLSADPFVLRVPDTVYDVGFTADGKRIIAACLGGEQPLRIFEVATGAQIVAAGRGNLSALAISSDGTRLATGRSRSSSTLLLDDDGAELKTFAGHHWRTNWVAFRNGDRELLSLGNDGSLRAIDIESERKLQTHHVKAESVGEGCRAAINTDQTILALASRGVIQLLDFKTWEVLGELSVDTSNIYALAFSPDGNTLVAGSANSKLRVWDVAKRELIDTLSSHSAEIYAIEFSPDGSRFCSAGRDRVIRIWDAQRLEEITQLHGHTSLVYCMAFSPDGQILASAGGDDCIRLWSTDPYRDRKRKP